MKKFIFIVLFLISIMIISACGDAAQESPRTNQIQKDKKGGDGPIIPPGPEFQDYEMIMESNYDINSTTEIHDGILFTARERGSYNDGFMVGGHITNRVFAAFSNVNVRDNWGPVYYEDVNGDWQSIGSLVNFLIMLPGSNTTLDGEWTEVEYRGIDGKILIGGDGGNLLGRKNLIEIKVASLGEYLPSTAFRGFGYYDEHAELDEMLVWSSSTENGLGEDHIGNIKEDVRVGDRLVVRDPDENFNSDTVKLSFLQ